MGLSRPTVVRLVDEGLIPALVPGKVRRKLKLADVLAFQATLHARRHRFITEISDAYHDEIGPADLDSLVGAARKSG